MIRIEPEPSVADSRCETCGGTNHLLHGFVYDDGGAHGVYFVEWCDGDHPDRAAYLTVGLGAFGAGSTPGERAAFGIEWRRDGMSLTDSPVRDRPELLGAFVPRNEAIARPEIDHLWHVADHIVLEDDRLAALRDWLA